MIFQSGCSNVRFADVLHVPVIFFTCTSFCFGGQDWMNIFSFFLFEYIDTLRLPSRHNPGRSTDTLTPTTVDSRPIPSYRQRNVPCAIRSSPVFLSVTSLCFSECKRSFGFYHWKINSLKFFSSDSSECFMEHTKSGFKQVTTQGTWATVHKFGYE